MAESVRLSDASREAGEALANFDQAALEQLLRRLERVTKGDVQLEAEPATSVENNQRLLASILVATEQSMATLHRLRERKAGDPWAL